MEQLGALFLRVCTVSAGCSVVLALLLALLPKLREKIAARSLYVLFLVLALRLLLPVEIKLPAPAVTVHAPDYTLSVPVPRPGPAESNVGQVQPVLDPVESPQPAPVRSIPVLHILALAWALGAAGCVLCSAGGFLLARRRLLKGSVSADIDLEPLRRELGVRRPVRPVRPVRLVYSAAAPCPLALGLLRPVIVLPAGQPQVDELVLRHELTHIRRWDVAYKLVLSLACWVNWFNPLVWLMDKAAGRNLELCCDDEVTRDLPDGERRRYGNLLLDASAARAKERLLNLFAHKRNSAALVGLVLIAALLAGGLVACEKADASAPTGSQNAEPMGAGSGPTGSGISPAPTIMPQDQANRELLEMYFYENFHEDECSVVLADLTGDGLAEMLVLTMHTASDTQANLRQPVSEEEFAYGTLNICGVKDGAVFQYNSTSDVANSHAGWRYVYLVPRSDGNGYALFDFSPYIGQGMASYAYGVHSLDEANDEWTALDTDEAFFSLVQASLMGPNLGDDATSEETQAFLDRAQAYRDSGVVLLAFYSDGEKNEFSYLNAPPADTFAGNLDAISALRGGVVTNGYTAKFPLPPAGPASPEEALDLLEASLAAYPDGYVFRIPNYKGEWNIHIAGRMRMDAASHPADTPEMYMSVHYLEDEEWIPGKRYNFDTGDATFSELTLTATVTGPDRKSAERTIDLAGPRSEVDSDLPDGPQEDVGSPLPDGVHVIYGYGTGTISGLPDGAHVINGYGSGTI